MANAIRDISHRRPHPQPLAAPYLEFDLDRELAALCAEPEWLSGQNAKTLVKYNDLRVVLTALRQNARLPRHQTDGHLSIHVVRGHVQMQALGRTFDLAEGRLIALDRGTMHEIVALTEAALLMTIAWPPSA
jgi:quercetin dioxygenase-like cupin family protein